MTRGIRYRLMAFVVLSAIGITYVTATYLGLVDRVTGRDLNVTVTLPQSGGLFEGSEVTYRGVKIGKISAMATSEDGIELAADPGPRRRTPHRLLHVRAQPVGGG